MQTKASKIVFISGLLILGALVFFLTKGADKDLTHSSIISNSANSNQQNDQTQNQTDNNESVPTQQPELSEAERSDNLKLNELSQILSSKNDNDPRLDKEFKNLTPSLKNKMIDLYKSYLPEQLNEKGTIAFLLSRDIQSIEDLDQLKIVFEEPPCKSPADCNADIQHVDPHHSGSTSVDLSYPQMASLYQIEQKLKKGLIKDPKLKAETKSFLVFVSTHPVDMVRNKAKEILKKNSL